MDLNWDMIDNFDPEDFEDPDFPGSWKYMNPDTIIALQELRTKTGWPIIPHNKYGIKGCLCVEPGGHSAASYHYKDNKEGPSAVDWHFRTAAHSRTQIMAVLKSGFSGIGLYQGHQWTWGGKSLAVGFHTDMRKWPQVWKKTEGNYVYLLT